MVIIEDHFYSLYNPTEESVSRPLKFHPHANLYHALNRFNSIAWKLIIETSLKTDEVELTSETLTDNFPYDISCLLSRIIRQIKFYSTTVADK